MPTLIKQTAKINPNNLSNNILSLEKREQEREKALKALERAKKIAIEKGYKTIFLPRGASGSVDYRKPDKKYQKQQCPEGHMTAAEAGKIIGISAGTLQSYYQKGKVPGLKVLKKVYFRIDEVYKMKAERDERLKKS